jgi:hypothetical protein
MSSFFPPMTFPYGETVTHIVRTASGRDGDGNDTWTETSMVINNVAVAPRDSNGSSTSNEQTQGRDTVTIGLTIGLPSGTVVAAVDRFIIRGNTYDVEGQPESLLNPFTGWNPGLPVALKRVTG